MLISTEAKIYRPERISFGDYCRVDDFVTLLAGPKGSIELSNRVHIAAYSMIDAADRVTFGEYSGLSARVTVYGCTDDYFGGYLTNPCVPETFRRVSASPIYIGSFVVVGTSSVILPGAYVADGCAIGAMSLVKSRLEPWSIYSGNPVRRILARSRKLVEVARALEVSTGTVPAETVV